MDHTADLRGRDAVLGDHLAHPVQDSAGRVVVGGQQLAGKLALVLAVMDDDIGERAADVDAERIADGHGRAIALLAKD